VFVHPYLEHKDGSLYLGDNVAVMKEVVRDESIDLVVTSPPYDNLRTYGGHSWDFEGVAQQLWRVIKPGGVVVWVVNDETIDGSETGTSFRQALRFMEIGFRLTDTMIWTKGAFSAVGSTAVRYGPAFEFMFVLSKGKTAKFNPISDRKNAVPFRTINGTIKDKDGTARPVSNIGKQMGECGIRFNYWLISPDKDSLHPAPFPEAIARDHILSWSNENDIVLDPFAGSGTTAKMARMMGRRFIGIEINPEYCEIAANRLRQNVLPFDLEQQEAPG
jgi:DNA modification methylase